MVRNKGLVKTVQFGVGKYVGDPINAVRIFNEKEADELVVLDIDATIRGRDPDYGMIKKLASECRMPFCYGGGIATVRQASKIIGLGVEKITLSAAALEDSTLVKNIANEVGNQSVVVTLDVKKKKMSGKYEIYTHNGTRKTGRDPIITAREMEKSGAGEIIINSIDNDGTMKGYDNRLIKLIRDAVDIPITALGGAGSYKDMKDLVDRYKIIGAAAGSLFVFRGKYRAVLISYPDRDSKNELLSS